MTPMEEIKYYSQPKLKEPTLLAGWPGMGNVALQAIDYLREKLETTLFAEIDTSQFAVPEAVIVNKGLAVLPKLPRMLIYAAQKENLIIAVGEDQFYRQAGIMVIEKLLKIAQDFKVKRIFTGAAFSTYMSCQDDSKVYIVANNLALRDWLSKEYNLEIMADGQISGLNGLLLGYAQQKKLEAACFLATLPMYAINLPNPKASRAIVEVLMNLLNLSIDLTDLNLSIKKIDSTLEKIEEQIQKLEDKEQKEPLGKDLILPQTNQVPKEVIEKIEKLFEEVKLDKKKAHLLKEELDRWDLFKAYEDRFLDLFKEGQ